MKIDLSAGVVPISTRVMNLSQFLSDNARRHQNEIGLVWKDNVWTWAELEARSAAFAYALVHEFNVKKGERIIIQSTNNNQMFETMFACWRVGAVWVPANWRQSPEEVAALVDSTQARGMICESRFTEHARLAAPKVEFQIAIGEADFASDYEGIIARNLGRVPEPVPVCRDDPAWFFLTSGTTGHPKAAILTHGQMAFVVTNHLCDLMPATGPLDASIVVAPLSHGAGIHQLAQTAHGVKTILLSGEKFDPEEVWSLVEKWHVTNMFTVPTIVKMLVEHSSVNQYDRSSLRYVIYAGAPMYRADQVRALEILGTVLVQYFGLGEVTGNITVLPPYEHYIEDEKMRIGTCGFARTAMQVQIQDENGVALPNGETGEIAVIGPAVFAGYFNNREANAKSFRNGWFLTGDLGHMDEDGFLYLTGRSSDMYISGGSNIYPREIEEKILLHPAISEVAVVGVPDALWGEAGLAVCVPKTGMVIEPEALLEWLDQKLARYKTPRSVVIWDEMPKSAYGKITKKLIREELIARGEIVELN